MIPVLSLLSLVLSVASDGEETGSWEAFFEGVDTLRARYGIPPISPAERMKILIGQSPLPLSQKDLDKANGFRNQVGIPSLTDLECASLLTKTHWFPPEWMVGFLSEETRRASGIRRKWSGPLERGRYGRYVGIYRKKPDSEPDRPLYDLFSFLSMTDPFFPKETRKISNFQIVGVASKKLLVPFYYYLWLELPYGEHRKSQDPEPLKEGLVTWPWE